MIIFAKDTAQYSDSLSSIFTVFYRRRSQSIICIIVGGIYDKVFL